LQVLLDKGTQRRAFYQMAQYGLILPWNDRAPAQPGDGKGRSIRGATQTEGETIEVCFSCK
jgi:hypothetical protein